MIPLMIIAGIATHITARHSGGRQQSAGRGPAPWRQPADRRDHAKLMLYVFPIGASSSVPVPAAGRPRLLGLQQPVDAVAAAPRLQEDRRRGRGEAGRRPPSRPARSRRGPANRSTRTTPPARRDAGKTDEPQDGDGTAVTAPTAPPPEHARCERPEQRERRGPASGPARNGSRTVPRSRGEAGAQRRSGASPSAASAAEPRRVRLRAP
ncbi:hypothetical protein HBB16_07885 [Pseudonocardia sp. MCCB 268]|nr:hypothetical protein [Pseudonocardia cytotoxica]